MNLRNNTYRLKAYLIGTINRQRQMHNGINSQETYRNPGVVNQTDTLHNSVFEAAGIEYVGYTLRGITEQPAFGSDESH